MTIQRYESQQVLFKKIPDRSNLLDIHLQTAAGNDIRVNVWRNHAFETLVPLMEPYCNFGNWTARFHFGSYDDSLMFDGWQQSEVELLWLDSSRFDLNNDFDNWLAWIHDRLGYLRSLSKAPIILATWMRNNVQVQELNKVVDQFPAVYFADLMKTCDDVSVELLDQRTARFAGTPVGNKAQLIIARELACHWLTAVFLPPIKALAVDLDNTIHGGILGEDGAGALSLDNGYLELQKYIKSLLDRGIFIALVSRNERDDVEALFSLRKDYPLRWDDFSAIEVSWGDKSSAINRVANTLRISPDSILFVDDNPGELANVEMDVSQVHTVYAHSDAGLTKNVISYYPGLWRWKVDCDDTKRIRDLMANVQRDSLSQNSVNTADYFRRLHVVLHYRLNSRQHLSRLADICGKTNQFNLALRRYNQAEISQFMDRVDACVVCVQLTDNLSDSGIIAVIVASRNERKLVIEELCISCRALGRRLEDTIIISAIRDMPIFDGCDEVEFCVKSGPRNQPSLNWLMHYFESCGLSADHAYSLHAKHIRDYVAVDGVILSRE